MNTSCTLECPRIEPKTQNPILRFLKNWLETVTIPGAEFMSKTK